MYLELSHLPRRKSTGMLSSTLKDSPCGWLSENCGKPVVTLNSFLFLGMWLHRSTCGSSLYVYWCTHVCTMAQHGLLSFHPSQVSWVLTKNTVTTCTVTGPTRFQRHLKTLTNSFVMKDFIPNSYMDHSKIAHHYIAQVVAGLFSTFSFSPPRWAVLSVPTQLLRALRLKSSILREVIDLCGNRTWAGCLFIGAVLPFSKCTGCNRLSPPPPDLTLFLG